MSYDLRPRSFVEIFDQSFRLLRDHFVSLVGVMVVLMVPYTLAMALFAPKQERGAPMSIGTSLMILGLTMMLLGLILPLAQIAVTRTVAEACLGRSLGLADALRSGLKLYSSYVGTILWVMLSIVLWAFLLVIPGVYFAVAYSLVASVAVVEHTYGRAAMRRSRALVKGSWWRTFAIMMAATLLQFVVAGGVNMIVGSVPIVGPVLIGVVQGVGAAFLTVVFVVYYFDLRCRKEDFDLIALAQQVGQAGPHELSSAATGAPRL